MTKQSFRRNLRAMGYRLHKHGDLYDLIDIKGNFLILGNSTIEDIAEHIMQLHFPAPGGDAVG